MAHTHIISIYDVFEENDTAYYVMEYIDGGSLKERIETNGAGALCILTVIIVLFCVLRSRCYANSSRRAVTTGDGLHPIQEDGTIKHKRHDSEKRR